MAFVSVSEGVGASQRTPLSVLARNPHKGLAHNIFHETGRRRQKRAVSRRNQSTEESSQEKRAGSMACGLRGWVGQHERMNQRSWWLYGNFARIHARDSLQKDKKLGKCHKLLPSCAWSKPKSVFDCSLFFHPFACVCCVLCVRKEMWNTPGWRWEKLLDDLMIGLGGWDRGLLVSGILSQRVLKKNAFLYTHSSVNIIWFIIVCYRIFNDRPLFKPRSLWYVAILNILKTNIFARKKWFLAINQ